MPRRTDDSSHDLDGAAYFEEQVVERGDDFYEGDVDEEDDGSSSSPAPVSKILVTSRLIVALIRYGLLPGDWRLKYQTDLNGKLKSHQMAHIEREDFATLAEALLPIMEGERELETNQMRYAIKVYEIVERETRSCP